MRGFLSARLGGCLAIALLTAGPALSQVTAKQVWENWRASAADLGQTVRAGSVVMRGDTLYLENVTTITDGDGLRVEVEIPSVTLTEQAGGTVTIAFSPQFPVDVIFTPDPGETATSRWMVEQSETVVQVEGVPEAMRYSTASDQILVRLEQMMVGDARRDATFEMTARGVAGDGVIETGGLQASMRLESLDVAMTALEPEMDIDMSFSMSVADLRTDSELRNAHLWAIHEDQPSRALSEGAAVELEMQHGAARFDMASNEPDGDIDASGRFESGGMTMALGRDGLGLQFFAGPMASIFSGPDLPAPLDYAMEDFAFGFSMPMLAGTAPQPFSLTSRLGGFAPGESLWAMFDPSGALPRDPADFELDLSGTGQWNYEIMDMDEPPEGVEPGTLRSLTLNSLRVFLAGADLRGSGALTFPEDGVPSALGVDFPAGRMSFSLDGANRLLDTLTQTGLLPNDQAMFARMMLGMLARPTGNDSFESEVTFGTDGTILVNGMPMPF